MPSDDVNMDGGDGTATPAEQVWCAVQRVYASLMGDIVCLAPGAATKTQVKQKFAAKEPSLKEVLIEQVSLVMRAAALQAGPESRTFPGRVNFTDLKANLADEWTTSLDELFQAAKIDPLTETQMDGMASKRDFLV